MLRNLEIGNAHWVSSIVFVSWNSCPELAALAIRRVVGREVFTFTSAIEKDHMARSVLSGHAFGCCLHSDILARLPDRTRAMIAALDRDKLRAAVFDSRFQLDLTGRTAERYFSVTVILLVRRVWIFLLWVPGAKRAGQACFVFTSGREH